MKAHELARLLLAGPDLEIVTEACNRVAVAEKVGIMTFQNVNAPTKEMVAVGDWDLRMLGAPNSWISDMVRGEAADAHRGNIHLFPGGSLQRMWQQSRVVEYVRKELPDGPTGPRGAT